MSAAAIRVSPATYRALLDAGTHEDGFRGAPTPEAMKRLGFSEAEIWRIAQGAKIVVEGEGRGPAGRVLP